MFREKTFNKTSQSKSDFKTLGVTNVLCLVSFSLQSLTKLKQLSILFYLSPFDCCFGRDLRLLLIDVIYEIISDQLKFCSCIFVSRMSQL